MGKVKVGDKIEITADENGAPVGSIVTVIRIESNGSIIYEYKEDGEVYTFATSKFKKAVNTE